MPYIYTTVAAITTLMIWLSVYTSDLPLTYTQQGIVLGCFFYCASFAVLRAIDAYLDTRHESKTI